MTTFFFKIYFKAKSICIFACMLFPISSIFIYLALDELLSVVSTITHAVMFTVGHLHGLVSIFWPRADLEIEGESCIHLIPNEFHSFNFTQTIIISLLVPKPTQGARSGAA